MVEHIRVKAPALFALAMSGAFAARADVVDLSRSSRRGDSDLGGFSVRAEFGNDFAPYGIVGAAFSYMVPTGTAFEAGLGAGFPGLQLGGGFELRPGPFTASLMADLAFTPADGEAHFGFHGGLGYYF